MLLKLIPNTRGFLASEDGKIYSPDGAERNYYRNGDGYITTSVLLMNGKWQTFGVHRLVALAHLEYAIDPINLTANHIDGNVENNHKSNLELISVALNNIHAALLRGSGDRPTILSLDGDGNYRFISNLQKACKIFNADCETIWRVIQNKGCINGCKLTYLTNSARIPKSLRKRPTIHSGVNQQLKFLNIQTQEELKFETLKEAASYFSTNSSHIHQCVSVNGKIKLFKQLYLIVRGEMSFPVLTQDRYDQLMNITGKDVIAYNVKDKKFVLFNSAAEFIRFSRLSKKAVTVDLRKDRLREISGWWYTYMTDSKIRRLKNMVGVQS